MLLSLKSAHIFDTILDSESHEWYHLSCNITQVSFSTGSRRQFY